jgi:dihydroorotate dehydrogenase
MWTVGPLSHPCQLTGAVLHSGREVIVEVYTSLLRPLLFRLPADRAHELGKTALASPAPWRIIARGARARANDPSLQTNLGGLRLRNPIGLAPGFDKSGALVPALVELGFGYVVVGSITPAPRTGNPLPRLLRYPDQESVANCMGMPNPGLEAAARLLARPRRPGVPVIAAVAGATSEELLESAARLEPVVDGIEIGLVCRHTPETFEMAELPTVAALVAGLARQKTKPTFLKVPPHHNDAERKRTLSIVELCADAGLEGVSISGTRQAPEPRLSMGAGGVAGRSTTPDALRILDDVATAAKGRLAIKASGGVFSGRDAQRFLDAGATTVELYSGFIYRGPMVAASIARELAQLRRAAVGAPTPSAPAPRRLPDSRSVPRS